MNKQDYFNATKAFLFEKIKIIEDALKDTQASSNTETKSSAGDKHETSRAMAHIENERLAGQLSALQQQVEVINKINPAITSEVVSFGSVVETETTTFFISTGIGKIKTEDSIFFAIASNSPVGSQLKGKSINDKVKVGQNEHKIIGIL